MRERFRRGVGQRQPQHQAGAGDEQAPRDDQRSQRPWPGAEREADPELAPAADHGGGHRPVETDHEQYQCGGAEE